MINFTDFKNEPSELVESQIKAVQRVIKSGWYILGDELVEFERA